MSSIDGLLSEKSTFLGSNLAVRAADQAYFGGHRIYTHVPPSTSKDHHGEHNSHGHGHGHGGHGHGHGHGHGKEIVPKADMHLVPKGDLHVAIQYAKEIVAKALSEAGPSGFVTDDRLKEEMKALRKENEAIRKELAELRETIEKFTRMQVIPAKYEPVEEDKKNEKSADEDFDLFGSDDEEDAEKAKVVEERLKAYAEKKSKKPGPIAKSSVILDVKPWDDETDLKEMESLVRGIEMDGLVWGGAKNLPIGYGISKLQIICVIEDDKVSVDDLIDKITGDFESHVQSVDIVAFNKI
uniref:Elongation factor 1-beta n=1 Tax=Haemonchus contortus TaxID=6289 RepID=A0A7I4Y0S0_HAECO